MTRSRFAAALLFACSIATAMGATAQYPSRPIKWIVPYTPGGITDSATRMIAQKLEGALGQPIVIENKPGANSIVGADAAARSNPDGYTFVTVIGGHAANATLYAGKLPFDAVKSFAPVSVVGIAPLIIVANNDFPAKDMKELIAYAKANPGKVSFGSSGIGAAAHLTTELLKQTADINMVHIPYKGTAPALTALLGGDIQILTDVPSSLMAHVRAGKARALGLFAAKRSPGAPEVPTVAEAGGPPIEGSTWVLFLAPAGTPREIVNKLNSEIGKLMSSPETKKVLFDAGVEVALSSPEALADYMLQEMERWGKVVKETGIKLE